MLTSDEVRGLQRYLDPEKERLPFHEFERIEGAVSRLSNLRQEVLVAAHGEKWPERKAALFPGLDSHPIPVRLLVVVARRANVSEMTLRRWALFPDEHQEQIRALRLKAWTALFKAQSAYRRELKGQAEHHR